jgi:hypothetical protein
MLERSSGHSDQLLEMVNVICGRTIHRLSAHAGTSDAVKDGGTTPSPCWPSTIGFRGHACD